ncbi:MAG: protein containing YHS domain protein [Pirellulaceae bacterium]|nr:protein containing YHS domain protein [Pirellulaceae bacterium]
MNTKTPQSQDRQALKIGVMGAAGHGIAVEHLQLAEALGEAVATSECVLVTGGCPGLPLAAAKGAKQCGGLVIGISPGLSLEEHSFKFESPTVYHDVLIFTGSGLMGREVVNIRSSDIVVIIGGSSGTLGELAIAYDEGKLIGVLTGTGGISDLVESILAACNKQTGARVVYDADPRTLLRQLLTIYKQEHFRHPSVFCRAANHYDAAVTMATKTTQDPICGMLIAAETAAAKRTRADQRHYFCSLQCAASFDDGELPS